MAFFLSVKSDFYAAVRQSLPSDRSNSGPISLKINDFFY